MFKRLLITTAIGFTSACSYNITEISPADEDYFMSDRVKRNMAIGIYDSDKDGIWDAQDKCRATRHQAGVTAQGCAADDDGDGLPNYADTCPAVVGTSDSCGCEQQDMVYVHFDEDSYTQLLQPVARGLVARFDHYRRNTKNNLCVEKITVKGFTDNRGEASYNQALAEKRARHVSDYLVSLGLPVRKIKITGHGEDQPIATNINEAGRAKNRRVEIETHYTGLGQTSHGRYHGE